MIEQKRFGDQEILGKAAATAEKEGRATKSRNRAGPTNVTLR